MVNNVFKKLILIFKYFVSIIRIDNKRVVRKVINNLFLVIGWIKREFKFIIIIVCDIVICEMDFFLFNFKIKVLIKKISIDCKI